MLHINDFKFRLKEHLEEASLNNHSGMVKTKPEPEPFNKIPPYDKPSMLVTLGPKSSSSSSIEKIKEYTKLFRLNGSHNTIDWHIKVSNLIRKVCPEALILLDIPGIKPRTNNKKTIEIRRNEAFEFYYGYESSYRNLKKIELTKPIPKLERDVGSFSLSDGLYEFELIDYKPNYIRGISKNNFQLLPKKGLNIPGSLYDDDLQLKVYLDFLYSCKAIDFDAIGLSFIQNQLTIEDIKAKFSDKLIVSKIENKQGVKNSKQIVNSSDIVMIDRGDLFAEVGIAQFYEAIIKIANTSLSYKRPLIMATENLDSMQHRLQPSKSEVISLQHSINLGSNLLMLSDETATSDLYMNTIRWLHEFLQLQGRESIY